MVALKRQALGVSMEGLQFLCFSSSLPKLPPQIGPSAENSFLYRPVSWF